MRRVLVLAALVLVAQTGCSTTTTDGIVLRTSLDPNLTEIDYQFTDSSLPPEYHRSYTLTANADGVSIVVESYGDVLHNETASVEDRTWQALVRAALSLAIPSSDDPDQCPGATYRDLQIQEIDPPLDANDLVLEAEVAVCGASSQARADAIDAFVAPLLELFDMEALLAPSN